MSKRVLRYLILLIAVVVAFVGNSTATGAGAVSATHSHGIPSSELRADCTLECGEAESTLFLPRQVSASNPTHLHGTTKRHNNAHKNNFEFTKSGKCFSTSIGGYIHQYQLTTHLSFTKSHHRLIGLGKLII